MERVKLVTERRFTPGAVKLKPPPMTIVDLQARLKALEDLLRLEHGALSG